jgi:pimeloyl-ACP methyl ester carboxylesterase
MEREAIMASSVNIVLVHGWWADGSSWSKVIALLQGAGYRTTAVPLAMNSLVDDIATVRRVVDAQGGPTVLVGHSYGGAVISGAGDAPNVKSLVFVAAFAPDEGESIGDLIGRYPPMPSGQHFRPDAAGYLYIDPDAFPQDFAQDLSPEEGRVLAAVQRPAKVSILEEKADTAAWRKLPTWFQVSTEDGIIPADLERFFADRMKAQTTMLATNHASLLSYPTEIAHMIAAAAQA